MTRTAAGMAMVTVVLLTSCGTLLPGGLPAGVRPVPRDAVTECGRSGHTLAVVIAEDVNALRRLFPSFGLAPELDDAGPLTVTVNDSAVPIPAGGPIQAFGGGLPRPEPGTAVLCVEAGEVNWYTDVPLQGSPYEGRLRAANSLGLVLVFLVWEPDHRMVMHTRETAGGGESPHAAL